MGKERSGEKGGRAQFVQAQDNFKVCTAKKRGRERESGEGRR